MTEMNDEQDDDIYATRCDLTIGEKIKIVGRRKKKLYDVMFMYNF